MWLPVHRAFSAAAVSDGGNMDTPKQFSTYSRKTCSRVWPWPRRRRKFFCQKRFRPSSSTGPPPGSPRRRRAFPLTRPLRFLPLWRMSRPAKAAHCRSVTLRRARLNHLWRRVSIRPVSSSSVQPTGKVRSSSTPFSQESSWAGSPRARRNHSQRRLWMPSRSADFRGWAVTWRAYCRRRSSSTGRSPTVRRKATPSRPSQNRSV